MREKVTFLAVFANLISCFVLICHTMCMEEKYTYARTCVYNINYHIVWCVKYRKKVLSSEIEHELADILRQIGEEKGFTVTMATVGEQDHVHCFVSAPPKLSPTNIVKYLKGISGRFLLMNHPELSEQLWNGDLWNGSYFIEAIGSSNEDVVQKYIEHQKNVQR